MSFAHFALRTASRASYPRVSLTIANRWSRLPPRANFSAAAGLSKDQIESRVLDVLKGFEKVDPAKLGTSSRFAEDLGLDSLDAVEVVMAVEEEFSIEIPDAEADEITSVQQAIEYIAKTPEAQ
ncbi:acyl carrier protein [Neolentinus lepideus HHB14362 ss-1]|uniref:Acyl carrier protein n=1 Tax=Neolentinus lepideus HHB14362 ss-1 TaxID=1314782 RepID=A0A165W0W7_9AGAM|nr:acyl carrier protein [Neolentinus lepideus HHB14362 ss-1]